MKHLSLRLKRLILSALFFTLALVLPFVTGQIPEIGSMLCPMHIPILLCGFICGPLWGLTIGLTAPILRSLMFGMPPMFPAAVCMAFELAAYGAFSGILHKVLPKKKYSIYISLIISMLIGRAVWGAARFICTGLDASKFGFSAFIAGAFTTAVPGIILQIIIVPLAVMLYNRVSDKGGIL